MFYSTDALPAAATLEAHWLMIRDECLALPQDEFAAWPEQFLYNFGWDLYGLYTGGRPLMEDCVFCPGTAALLGKLDGVVNAGFSRMAAGTHIRPHMDSTGAVWRLHLALRVTGDCGLRVGTQRRRWEEGRCLLFDGRVEHEAWNESPHDRLVLLIDFALPMTVKAI